MVLPVGWTADVVAETEQSVVVLRTLLFPGAKPIETVQHVQSPVVRLVAVHDGRLMLINDHKGLGLSRRVTELPEVTLPMTAQDHWQLIKPVPKEVSGAFPGPDAKSIATLKEKLAAAAVELAASYGVEAVVDVEFQPDTNDYRAVTRSLSVTADHEKVVWVSSGEIPNLPDVDKRDIEEFQRLLASDSQSRDLA